MSGARDTTTRPGAPATLDARRAEGGARAGERKPSSIHRLAVAGNTAALLMLVMLLANGAVLFEARVQPRPVIDGVPPRPAAGRAVLIIIDGLRRDTASDPAAMPALRGLARRGVETTAHVQSLIPSTIAGITTIATGEVPPPVSFVNDFRSGPARSGGIFEAVAEGGGTSFVAGPRLWRDLYGRWISDSHETPAIGSDDAGAVEALVGALTRSTHRLHVLHLGATDEIAHKHGSVAHGYADVVRWCDGAVGRIAAAAGPDALLVVTSDHGLTDRGGHAGPEPDVLRTPLILAGPGAPQSLPNGVPQSAVPALMLDGLGLERWRVQPEQSAPAPLISTAWVALCAGAALGPAMRRWRQLGMEREGRVRSFFLNGSFWVALAFVAVGWRAVALVAVVGVLVACGIGIPRGRPTLLLPLALGIVIGGVRLADGWHSLGRERALLAGALGLVTACMVGVAAGASLGRLLSRTGQWSRPYMPLIAGASLAVLHAGLARLLGNTTSLSTIDVRLAYVVAEGWLGLPAAAVVVFLTQAAPALALIAGIAPAWSRLPASSAGLLAASLAAVLAGQTLVAAILLSSSFDHAWSSLALGLTVRALAELSYFFLGAAFLLGLLKVRLIMTRRAARGP